MALGPELFAVAGSAIIILVLIFAQQIYNDHQKGAAWALGNRDDQEFNATSKRFERAVGNHLQNVAIFVPLALVVTFAELTTWWTALGAWIFLAARIGHSVTYALGITHIRSFFWISGIVGSVFMAWPIAKALF